MAATTNNAPARDDLLALEMCLIAQGRSVSDIAEQLALSVKTVSTYRTRILQKLGLKHNAGITRYALKHRLVD